MSENREEILANFQACTGIEDVGESILHLEETNWDLLKAIHRAIPQYGTEESSPDIEMIEEVPSRSNVVIEDDEVIVCNQENNSNNRPIFTPNFYTGDSSITPSTSQAKDKRRTLKFVIDYKDGTIIIELTDNQTVGDLKKLIRNHTQVPLCQQVLLKWKKPPESDNCLLSNLHLASETRLTLLSIDTTQDGTVENDEVVERLKLNYTLNIKTETNEYNLNFPGVKSILDVKTDVYALTSIPTRYQQWNGWPASIKDDKTLLAMSGINFPVHSFTLKSSETATTNDDKKKYKRIIKLDDSDDSSVEEFEDAAESFSVDDDIFIDDSRSRKLEPLIPDMVEDETAGCLHFSDEFTNRYGPLHPEFFPVTLDDAIKEACMKPARERRLLAVYLHHDGSVLANVFCTQLLCCDSVIQCLTANFVVWGWDLTYEWNKLKFMGSLTKSLGNLAALQIRNIPTERLPAIIIISRMRSTTEINAVIQGNVGVSELMASLTEAVDVYNMQQKIEIKEEDERTAREMIMFEQDAAYRESLEMDRAKEEAKKQQMMMENEEKERVEQERIKEEEKKEAYRLQVESRLPTEPPSTSNDMSITKLKFRLPKGESIERRFYKSEPLQDILDFLVVKGYPSCEFKVILSWPKRDLTEFDGKQTLSELKFCPQETVIVEER